jgi:alkylation response protein AidB-like acyl-CoA dehydrogenase
MQFKEEMNKIQTMLAQLDFTSQSSEVIEQNRRMFETLASPYIVKCELGILVSFIASHIGKAMVMQNPTDLPEMVKAKMLSHKTVIAVANSEANGGTDLREMRSFFDQDKLQIYTKYATNLGQADFVVCSFQKQDKIKLALIQLTPSMQTDLSHELNGLKGGVTGSFKADGLLTSEFIELTNSREKLQFCFNLERYLISLLCLCVMREAYQSALDYANSVKRSGVALVEHQFIQDKLFRLKKNIFQVDAMLNAIVPNSGYQFQSELSILKVCAVDAAFESVELVIEVCGKHSLTDKMSYLKTLSDLTCLRFLGGTRELHKITAIENEKRALSVTKNKSTSASA